MKMYASRIRQHETKEARIPPGMTDAEFLTYVREGGPRIQETYGSLAQRVHERCMKQRLHYRL